MADETSEQVSAPAVDAQPANGVSAPAAEPPKQFNIWEEISRRAEVNPGEIPFTKDAVWFAVGGKPTVITLNEDVPGNAAMKIFAMYHDSDEIRAYAAPKPNGGDSGGPRRYTYSKRAPVVVVDHMNDQVFMDEIAQEWRVSAGLTDDDYEEDEEPEHAVG